MASSVCALKSGFSVPGIASPGQDLPRFSSDSSVHKITHPTWVRRREKQITSITGRQRFVCLKCRAAIVEEPKPTVAKERGCFIRRGALIAAVVATGLSIANISPGQIFVLRSDHSLKHMNDSFLRRTSKEIVKMCIVYMLISSKLIRCDACARHCEGLTSSAGHELQIAPLSSLTSLHHSLLLLCTALHAGSKLALYPSKCNSAVQSS